MSIVNRFGIDMTQELRPRHEEFDREAAERMKSMAMAAMLQAGCPYAFIAKHYKVHRTTVWRRVSALPLEVMNRAKSIMG